MQVDVDFQTAFAIVVTVGGAFFSMYQRHIAQQIKAANERMDKAEAAANKRWEKITSDIDDVESQLQHTRENYVTNQQFENRMNELSRQFEMRTVELSHQMEKILTKIDACGLPPARVHHPEMRKVEY